KNVIVTDSQTGGLTGIFEVLGGIAQDRSGVDAVARAQLGVTRQVRPGSDLTIRSDDHMGVDHRMGSDPTPVSESGRRMDDGGGMDFGGHGRNQSRNPTTQAVMYDAKSPPTMALMPTWARFLRRLGTRAPMPPIWMATLPKLANPHSA
ncbi:MAG: hypothetical protein RLZZ34_1597, partial [Verrucomicrobiota bacterium]